MRRAGGVVLVSLLFVLAACSGGSDGDESSSSTGEDDRDLGPLTEMLDTVPEVGTNASFVIVNDFDAARDANDLEDLDDDASGEEVADHLLALTLRAEGVETLPSEFAGGQSTDQEARVAEIGFGFSTVEADTGIGPG